MKAALVVRFPLSLKVRRLVGLHTIERITSTDTRAGHSIDEVADSRFSRGSAPYLDQSYLLSQRHEYYQKYAEFMTN